LISIKGRMAVQDHIGWARRVPTRERSSMPSSQDFDAAVRVTQEWIDDATQRLGWHDREKAYAALVGTMHALRDVLPMEEVVYLGGCFPPLLRGLYYEGWHPVKRPSPVKSRAAFLDRIHDAVHHDPGIDTEQAAHAVFALFAARLPADEIEDAKAATPKAVRPLWPS
jgi:uncharacterized protein (DUF2267 family)